MRDIWEERAEEGFINISDQRSAISTQLSAVSNSSRAANIDKGAL